MTKAVVLEIKEGYAAVLTDKGLVQKIRNEEYKVGQEILLPEAGRRHSAVWKQAAAAAAVIITLSGSSLYYASENVFAYSTVTVSAEDEVIELTLNKKNEVIAAKALDEKGKAIADSLEVSIRNRRPLKEAVEILTSEMDEPEISVESGSSERREGLENDLKEIIPERPADLPSEGASDNGNTDVRPEEGLRGAAFDEPGVSAEAGTPSGANQGAVSGTSPGAASGILPEAASGTSADAGRGAAPAVGSAETGIPADTAGPEQGRENGEVPGNSTSDPEERYGMAPALSEGQENAGIPEGMPATDPIPENVPQPGQGWDAAEAPPEGGPGMP